jgi:hypothetical protein
LPYSPRLAHSCQHTSHILHIMRSFAYNIVRLTCSQHSSEITDSPNHVIVSRGSFNQHELIDNSSTPSERKSGAACVQMRHVKRLDTAHRVSASRRYAKTAQAKNIARRQEANKIPDREFCSLNPNRFQGVWRRLAQGSSVLAPWQISVLVTLTVSRSHL